MNQTLEIIVRPDGGTQVQTHGFSGPGCRDASRFIEAALGGRQTERLTGEYYQGQAAENSQQLRHG